MEEQKATRKNREIIVLIVIIALIGGGILIVNYILEWKAQKALNESDYTAEKFHSEYMKMTQRYKKQFLFKSLSDDSIAIVLQNFERDCHRMDSLEHKYLITSWTFIQLQDSAMSRRSNASTFKLMLTNAIQMPKMRIDTLTLQKK